MQMTIYAFFPLLSSVIVLFCGVFIFLSGRRTAVRTLLSLICLGAFVWLSGYAMMYASAEAESALFWAGIGYNGVIFIPPLFYHFTITFLNLQRRKSILWANYAVSLAFLSINQTPLFLSGVRTYFWGFYPEAGPIYIFFIVYFFTLFSRCLSLLYGAFRNREEGAARRQRIRYISAAFGVAAFFGIFDYVPNYGIEVYPAGYIGAVVWVGLVTYAILRYRLEDIRLAFRKSLVYSISMGLLTGLFLVLVLALTRSLSALSGISDLKISIFSALTIALLFAPLKTATEKVVNRIFYRTTYDYYATIENVSHELAAKLDLKDIHGFIIDTVFNTMKLKEAYLLTANGDAYEIACVRTANERRQNGGPLSADERFFGPGSGVALYFEGRRGILMEDELPKTVGQTAAVKIVEELRRFHAEVVLPVFAIDSQHFLLLLGEKLSGDVFNDEDVHFLNTIANQAAIAVRNTSLYAEKINTERLASIGTIAATLAHEIKNPLASIKTFTQLLPEKFYDIDYRETFLKIVLGEIQRIDGLVTELLDFAKETPIQMSVIDAQQLLDETLQLVSCHMEKNSVQLVRRYQQSAPISCDPKKLKQALLNILINSQQAMGSGGTIEVELSSVRDYVTISINDSGAGIPQKLLGRIFDPFFSTKERGAGLGLAISKKIIEGHGGKITVESVAGRGTKFALLLPAAAAEADRFTYGNYSAAKQ